MGQKVDGMKKERCESSSIIWFFLNDGTKSGWYEKGKV